MIDSNEDDILVGKLAEILSEDQSDLVMIQVKPILQDLRAGLRDMNGKYDEINRKYEEINRKYEQINKKYEETNNKLGVLDGKFEDLKDLLTGPMGLNISRQVCSWIHDSWGENPRGGESYQGLLAESHDQHRLLEKMLTSECDSDRRFRVSQGTRGTQKSMASCLCVNRYCHSSGARI